MRAMILAAGRGERMRPLTDRLPKPLLEAGGHRLIEYHLALLAAHGVAEVVINLSWRGERIREALGDGRRFGLTILYSDEGPVAFGTGGGLFAALPLLGPEPFLVINGDVWTDLRLSALQRPAESLAHLVLIENPPHHPGGDLGLGRTYAGVALLHPQLFGGCEPGAFDLKPLLERAQQSGRLTVQHHDGAWTDVGTPERLAALDAALRLGEVRHAVLSSPVG